MIFQFNHYLETVSENIYKIILYHTYCFQAAKTPRSSPALLLGCLAGRPASTASARSSRQEGRTTFWGSSTPTYRSLTSYKWWWEFVVFPSCITTIYSRCFAHHMLIFFFISGQRQRHVQLAQHPAPLQLLHRIAQEGIKILRTEELHRIPAHAKCKHLLSILSPRHRVLIFFYSSSSTTSIQLLSAA